MGVLATIRNIATARSRSRKDAKENVPVEQRRLLLIVGAALFINHFDSNVVSLALPQIQRSLGIAEDQLGYLLGLSRLGVLGAFALGFLSDTIGRRIILMWTIIGTTVISIGTAFAQTPEQFFALQTAMRGFVYAEEILCFVVIVEEMAADRRGWALGRLSALGTLGTGLAAVLFGFFGNMPDGWRIMYLIGGAGLALLIIARRRLKETARFTASRGEGPRPSLMAPFGLLVRESPGRFAALAATTIPYTFGMAAAIAFVSKRFQEDLGYSPAAMSTLFIVGGALSFNIYYLGGSLTDRIGRKPSLLVAIPGSALMYGLIYISNDVTVATIAWIVGLFLMFGSEMVLSMIGSELFPTDRRSTAASARVVLGILGGSIGLMAQSWLYGVFGNHLMSIAVLLCFAPVALIPLFFLPETASRELEEIDQVPAARGV